ncbi:MAG: NAD(P)-dependent oxidoreductase, partial [Clostridia bacterium]|nr:NAD(P)-dependent oxidoreductase [Clostridia bacterium]
VYCSLADMADYRPAEGERYDVFFHLAWEGTTGDGRNDMYLQNRNVTYTLDAVSLAERFGCHTFVGAGSQAEYGRAEGKLSSATSTAPENGYGIAKLAAGQMSRIACRQKKIRHVWARILSVYGPYEGKQSMVMSTLIKLKQGEVPSFTKGEQIWDYLYSADAARALIAMAEKGRDGSIYCIGSGDPRPLADYIRDIRDAVAPGAELALGAIPYAKGQVMYLCADLTELTADTGFVPTVSFRDGIREMLAWYDEQTAK